MTKKAENVNMSSEIYINTEIFQKAAFCTIWKKANSPIMRLEVESSTEKLNCVFIPNSVYKSNPPHLLGNSRL